MKKYKEIFLLKKMLKKENIPFIFRNIFDGFQICYPDIKNKECSVIEHIGSYGHEQDLLEIMGLLTDGETDDDVLGYLNAENVFERIRKHYRGEWKNDNHRQ